MKRILLIVFLFSLVFSLSLFSQDKRVKIACIAFYNVENLFDTIDDPGVNDAEYTPGGSKSWDTRKYYDKLDKLARVIVQIGDDSGIGGPVVIGLAEVENLRVLEDLVNTELLRPLNYGIVHYDGPDRRGIDVALLYRKDYFIVTNSVSVRFSIADRGNFLSRDQLVVSGILDGDPMHFIVNHWPSRRGGEKRSSPLREAAGDLSRQLSDSLHRVFTNPKVMVMGDFNDNPNNKSMLKSLGAASDTTGLPSNGLYNPYYRMYRRLGIGTLGFRDNWSLFDMIVISRSLLNPATGYRYHSAKVFNRPFLLQKEGAYAGYPWRTHVGNNYLGGYSDHLPVYIYLIK